jgi:hypothetical protein
MHINRHVQFGRSLPNRPETLVIVEDAIRHAVDHCALEAEPGDGTLQLVGRSPRVGGRQHGKGRETIRMALHRLIQPVIGASRQGRPGFGIDRLQPGDRMR